MVVQRLAVIVKTLNLLRSNNLFYYLSVDDRYELFSSGEDGIHKTWNETHIYGIIFTMFLHMM